MVISKKHKFIFVAISKTGTSSIEQSLEEFNEVTLPKHASLMDISNYCKIGLNEYFKFCFVRNPFERVVSIYYQWKKKPFGLKKS